MDPNTCSAIVDFNVPGKSNPPPVKLTATVWAQSRAVATGTLKKYAIEFTDPSGKLASPSVPLNAWVQVESSSQKIDPSLSAPKSCIEGSPLVFKDQHDDNKKQVTLSGNKLSILPYDAPFGRDDRLCTCQSVVPACQFLFVPVACALRLLR